MGDWEEEMDARTKAKRNAGEGKETVAKLLGCLWQSNPNRLTIGLVFWGFGEKLEFLRKSPNMVLQ